MTDLFRPLVLRSGHVMPNRFMLAPLTNLQSQPDGVLGDDEFRWLTMRAEGGFGLTMTCATSIQYAGLGFPGQLGAYSEQHKAGLKRLAVAINQAGSHSVVQLHHSGMRTMADVVGHAPLCPSDNAETGARAMTLEEVEGTIQAFVDAAVRSQEAGFQGAEIHAAHGYLVCQFLSPEINQRNDAYGGSVENRERMLFDIIEGISHACGPGFSLGVRLSPERFGVQIDESLDLAARLLQDSRLDYLDMSLWDVFKEPQDPAYQGKSLLTHFAELPRSGVALGAAGKIVNAQDCRAALDAGLDFVVLGRTAILHSNAPQRIAADPQFAPVTIPVTRDYLAEQGLGEAFINYMSTWKGFVEAS